MIDFPHRIQRPLLDALRAICPRPTLETAFGCIWNDEIQRIAVDTARKVRHEAMKVDERLQNGRRDNLRVSYRGYIVGGIVVGLSQQVPNRESYGWYAEPTHNTKPYPKVPKFCCEMRGMRFGEESGHFCYCFFVAVGKLEADQGALGLMHRTRHMCEACRARARLPKYRRLFRDKTVSVTALPKEDIPEGIADFWELYEMPRLCEIHGEPWPLDSAKPP